MIDLNEYYARAEYGDDERAQKIHRIVEFAVSEHIIESLKYHEYVHLMGTLRKLLFKGTYAGLRSG